MPKQFTHQQWEVLLSETIEQIKQLSSVKGGEYAGDFDRLANFRRNAQDMDLTMEQVWRVYAGKHWDALTQWVKDRAQGISRPRAESLLGRADDLIVYSILLKAMILEAEEQQPLVETFTHIPAPRPSAAVFSIPRTERTCDHEWRRLDRYSDICVFCNSMKDHKS